MIIFAQWNLFKFGIRKLTYKSICRKLLLCLSQTNVVVHLDMCLFLLLCTSWESGHVQRLMVEHLRYVLWLNKPILLMTVYRKFDQGFWIYLYFRIRHSFAHVWTILNKMASFGVIAHVWTILNKMASFGVNIYQPSASEHGQNITNITMI